MIEKTESPYLGEIQEITKSLKKHTFNTKRHHEKNTKNTILRKSGAQAPEMRKSYRNHVKSMIKQ